MIRMSVSKEQAIDLHRDEGDVEEGGKDMKGEDQTEERDEDGNGINRRTRRTWDKEGRGQKEK